MRVDVRNVYRPFSVLLEYPINLLQSLLCSLRSERGRGFDFKSWGRLGEKVLIDIKGFLDLLLVLGNIE